MPGKRKSDKAHRSNIKRLRNENAALKHTIELLTEPLTIHTPNLKRLHRIVATAVFNADPTRARNYQGTHTRTQDWLSGDATTTTEGTSTQQARARVAWLNRQIGDFNNQLTGVRQRPDGQPRCWVRTTEHPRGLRLPAGSKICPVCLTTTQKEK